MSEVGSDQTLGKRYILHDQLGAGGMGAVYRATDRLTSNEATRTIALKRVTTPAERLEFASPFAAIDESATQMRLALANEFKALASLRHPHIISVLDYGFDETRQPYFTMSLLDNPRTLFQAGQDQPLAVKIELIIAILQALDYLHRRNIIHRDLKPGNVMVTHPTSDSVANLVKVLDFGLSVAGKRDADDLTEMAAGTLAYMAPELLQGVSASRASDLYAVGIMAFELLAGRHPFDTGNIGALVNSILSEPVDLSLLNTDYDIADVVGKLLDKNPKQRFSNANEVIEALCVAANLPLPMESLEIRESFLQAAQFVGRLDEFTTLLTVLTQAIGGKGSARLLGGESGVGKSRLLDELRTNALVEGVLVLRGQAVSEGSSPYQVWRDILRWLVLATPVEPDDASILKVFVPDIANLVDHDIPDAPPLDPQAMQNRLIAIVVDILSKQPQPVLILLEDVQWAGGESLVMLDRLSRIAPNLPLMIVGSYRDDEYPDLPASLTGMEGLWSFYIVQASLTQAAELADQMLAHAETTQDEVHFIVAHWVQGVTLWGQGKFESALSHLQQTIACYDTQKYRTLGFLFGQDPFVTCLMFSGHCLWPLGYPDRAVEQIRKAVALGQEVDHAFSEAFARTTCLAIYSRSGDIQAIADEVPPLMSLSTEHNFPLWVAWAMAIAGWAQTRTGNYAEGIPQLDQGIAIVAMIGAEIELQHTRSLQAAVYGQAGRADEGLKIIDNVFARLERGEIEDRSSEAELHRVKGELLSPVARTRKCGN